MEILNFAVIGCGTLARAQHIPNLVRNPRTRLQMCCDVSEQVLQICRDQFGVERTSTDWRKAIADPEVQAIVLATTEKVRLPVIAAAAAAGKAVFVEKPLAATLTEMREIQRVVHESGIPFCVGHNRRCAPALREAHRIFRAHMEHPRPCPWRFDREKDKRAHLPEDGTAAMSVRLNDDWYSWKGWVFDKTQAQHGPLLFEMTHFTDLCNWFLAAEPEDVIAMESGMLNHGVVFRYKTGEMASISMWANGTFGYPKELHEVFGNGGAVIVDHMLEVRTAGIADAPPHAVYPMINDRHPQVGTEGGLTGWLAKKRVACAEAAAKGDSSLIFTAEPDKGHAHMIDQFVDEILGVGPVVCGVDEAVLATRMSFAAIRSAQERRVVKIAEV